MDLLRRRRPERRARSRLRKARRAPPGRDEPDYAAKLHVALAPVYYHSYVLGHLTAAQLREHLERNTVGGPFYEREISGRYLQEAFFYEVQGDRREDAEDRHRDEPAPNAREDWSTTVLRTIWEPLNPAYFVETLR